MKILTLDIGGTVIKSGIIQNDILSEKKEEPSNAQLGGAHLLETVKQIITTYSGFNGIGISTAGQVDSNTGIIRYANKNIPAYTGTKVQEILQERFNVPVAVENDVNAAALGEVIYGAGKNTKNKDFLCLTYGTGIGGAIIIDRKIYKGAAFSAGEMGHIITHGKENSGYYEDYASTRALVENVQAVLPEINNGKNIFKNIENPDVKNIVDNWIKEVLYGLAGLIHIFNPSLIILGGGIMEENYIIDSLRKNVNDYIMPSFSDVVLEQAALGNDAGLWGIGYLAKHKTDNK